MYPLIKKSSKREFALLLNPFEYLKHPTPCPFNEPYLPRDSVWSEVSKVQNIKERFQSTALSTSSPPFANGTQTTSNKFANDSSNRNMGPDRISWNGRKWRPAWFPFPSSRIETASPRLPARFDIRCAPLSSDKSAGLKARFRASVAAQRGFLCVSVYTDTGYPLLIHGAHGQRITTTSERLGEGGSDRFSARTINVSIKNRPWRACSPENNFLAWGL